MIPPFERGQFSSLLEGLCLRSKTQKSVRDPSKGGTAWEDKTLNSTSVQGALQQVSDIKVYGDGDTFALWCKASSVKQGWMKSTKVANVPGGALVQVTTQQKNPDGSYAVAEALTFVPAVWLDTTQDPPQMVLILNHPICGTLYHKSDQIRPQVGHRIGDPAES